MRISASLRSACSTRARQAPGQAPKLEKKCLENPMKNRKKTFGIVLLIISKHFYFDNEDFLSITLILKPSSQ